MRNLVSDVTPALASVITEVVRVREFIEKHGQGARSDEKPRTLLANHDLSGMAL
jgi:hypothetical protein